jgi:2,5-diketo-D-gluconate reductase A
VTTTHASHPSTPIRTAMPPIGIGTWPLTGRPATDAVLSAIDAGYRFIDTAALYGNEDAVGVAIAESGVDRDELFITTKLRGRDHASGDVEGAMHRSLDALGVDQIDLYLIHWPMPWLDEYADAFARMLECRDAGWARFVGVSNFSTDHLCNVVANTGEAPAVNQIQMDPSIARLPIRAVHDEYGMLTQSWSPLGRGEVLDDPVVMAISQRIGCSPAQVILAWHVSQGVVPVVRSANAVRQAENIGALDVRLTTDDLNRLTSLDRGESAVRDVNTEEHL